MCYPKPGPRCSTHANKALKKRQEEFEAAVISNPSDVEGMLDFHEKLVAARKEFDSSTSGLRQLKVRAESNPDEFAERYAEARTRREVRLDMMKEMNRNLSQSELVESRSRHYDDEVVTPSPVPESFPETYEHPELGKFQRADKWSGHDFSYMRVELSKPLNEEDRQRLAGLTGYAWTRLGAERLLDPVEDGSHAFTVFADSTKSGSDDVGIALEDFNQSLKTYVKEGSPTRKTKNNTRLIEGFGDDTEVRVYYSEV